MKIGNTVKSVDFNTNFFIQEKIITRNNNTIKIKFGNKTIFQKIINNLFIENNYRQGSLQHNFLTFSSIASNSTPAIFYFFVPSFLDNLQCKIKITILSAVYFSKILSSNISTTISTLKNIVESNSNNSKVYVADDYKPPAKTTQTWQGAGYSQEVTESNINESFNSVSYWYTDSTDYGHAHLYKIIGVRSGNLYNERAYHSHYFEIDAHDHEVVFDDHIHVFSPHQHGSSSYSHNHEINLKHKHNIDNNIYTLGSAGSLLKILLDDKLYTNNSKININSGKHTLKVYISGNISKIQSQIEIIGNYI